MLRLASGCFVAQAFKSQKGKKRSKMQKNDGGVQNKQDIVPFALHPSRFIEMAETICSAHLSSPVAEHEVVVSQDFASSSSLLQAAL